MSSTQLQQSTADKITLSNGLTLLLDSDARFTSASVGISILGGLRDEPLEKLGITHLLEHLLFKRTKTKGVREIASLMDAFGSGIEAFTDADSLCLQACVAEKEVEDLLDFLAELLCETAFDEQDLEKERRVVRQEILDCQDDPGEVVFQELSRRYWPTDVLRYPVFGTLDCVDSITRDELYSRLKALLVGRRIVIGVSGAFSPTKIRAKVSSLFEHLPEGARPKKSPALTEEGISIVSRPFGQVYFAFACPWPSERAEGYLSGQLLSFVLGEGMSSRLFQVLREEEGLLYDISSGVDTFGSTAMLVISGAVERSNFPRVMELILGEIQKVREHLITETELEEAKKHYVAQFRLEYDCLGSRLWRAIETESMYERYISVEESIRKVESIDLDSISELISSWLLPINSLDAGSSDGGKSKQSTKGFTFCMGGDVDGLDLSSQFLSCCGGVDGIQRT